MSGAARLFPRARLARDHVQRAWRGVAWRVACANEIRGSFRISIFFQWRRLPHQVRFHVRYGTTPTTREARPDKAPAGLLLYVAAVRTAFRVPGLRAPLALSTVTPGHTRCGRNRGTVSPTPCPGTGTYNRADWSRQPCCSCRRRRHCLSTVLLRRPLARLQRPVHKLRHTLYILYPIPFVLLSRQPQRARVCVCMCVSMCGCMCGCVCVRALHLHRRRSILHIFFDARKEFIGRQPAVGAQAGAVLAA